MGPGVITLFLNGLLKRKTRSVLFSPRSFHINIVCAQRTLRVSVGKLAPRSGDVAPLHSPCLFHEHKLTGGTAMSTTSSCPHLASLTISFRFDVLRVASAPLPPKPHAPAPYTFPSALSLSSHPPPAPCSLLKYEFT